MRATRTVTYVLLAAPIVLLGIVPVAFRGTYLPPLLYNIIILMILAKSWNIIGGYGGQVFLGSAAFFGWGGYTAALLHLAGLPIPLCILLAGFSAACLALILTPTFKLRGVYFVVGSLFIGEIVRVIVLITPQLGGAAGIILPLIRERLIIAYYSAFVIMLATILATILITRSRIGLALKAIRDDQDAAESYGINSTTFKLLALVIAALFAGMAGGTHAFYMVFIEPHAFFEITWSIIPVFSTIVGGVGTLLGPIIGVLIYMLLREIFIFLAGEIYLTMLGALLVAVILLAPEGFYPSLLRVIRKVRQKRS